MQFNFIVTGSPMISHKSLLSLTSGIALALGAHSVAAAQDADTFNSSFAVPIYNSIDENGVDLTTGVWRVRTPTVADGDGTNAQVFGLEWTGESWRHVKAPSIWRDGSKYIVQFDGKSYEFKNRSNGFEQRAPVDGSTLDCRIFEPQDIADACAFVSGSGDVVYFQGVTPFAPVVTAYGPSSLRFGNLGMNQVNVSRASQGNPQINAFSNTGGGVPGPAFGSGNISGGDQFGKYTSFVVEYYYNEQLAYIGGNRLTIRTPRHGGDKTSEHYLRPKDDTQTVTDAFGNTWQYTFADGSDRQLERVRRPGGLADITATYDSNERVKTITTPAGTWTYAYADAGSGIRMTTVTNPQGEVTKVTYDDDDYYVTKVVDPLNRTTIYNWNSSTKRLTSIVYPEGNRTEFVYDARGNVTDRKDYPKSGGAPLVSQARGFPACTDFNRANCNKPRWTIDPKGNRTDFEYTGNIHAPTKVIRPAPAPGQPRPTVTNQYAAGYLVRSEACPTQATCTGSPDEIVTQISYKLVSELVSGGIVFYQYRVPVQESVTSNGETLTTCHQYDSRGRLISSTPPMANIATCPTDLITSVATNANPPENSTKSTPVFSVGTSSGGGGSGGGGGVNPNINEHSAPGGGPIVKSEGQN